MSLRELYQEIIIDHGRQPRNFGKLMSASHSQMGHNPLCGDKLIVHILSENNLIKDIRFEGSGCAISVASASLMTEAVKGKSVLEAEQLFEKFHELVTKGEAVQIDVGKLNVFGGVAEFPIRVKCATLAWHTLKAAILHQINPVSTE